MKKGTLLVLSALVILSLVTVSCGAPPLETYKFKLAETHPKDYPTEKADRRFAELANTATGGKFTVDVYSAKQLGEEKAALEQVQLGAGVVDITRVSLSVFSSFVKETEVMQLPYLYRSQEHMWNVLNSPIGAQMAAACEKANFVFLCWYESGSRNFYTSKPVATVADLKGMKIRVQQAPVMVSMVESLGAVATPLDFGAVYTAIQSKTVDGAENNWPSYLSTKHYEVAKYLIVDEHTRVPEIMVVSKKVFDRVPKAMQDLIRKAAQDSVTFQLQQWNDYEKVAEAEVKKLGAIITVPTAEQKAAFQTAMKPLYDKQSPEAQKVIAAIQAIK